MDKHQAEQALSIIRRVIENTHEDLVAHNWGLIWMVHAFTNAAAFGAIGWIESHHLSLAWYFLPLAVVSVVNIANVLVLADRDRGVRSFVLWQLHAIWISFVVFSTAAALSLWLRGAEPVLFCTAISAGAGFGFAMMGIVFDKQFLYYAGLFLLVVLLAPVLGYAQWFAFAARGGFRYLFRAWECTASGFAANPMNAQPLFSEPPLELDDKALAVLVACQQRGVLRVEELERLLRLGELDDTCARLQSRGLLQRAPTGLAISHAGKLALDQLCESLQGELAPDDPAYERRFRRENPTLPFEANTTWAEAICANFRVAPEALRPLVPEMFELDLFGGWAWISLTASRLRDFGMGKFPRALRMNFYQATYRAHVTFTDFRGRRLRGCYFVRSETNSHVMSLTANLLPEFKAHHCSTYPIVMARHGDHLVLTVDSAADPAGKVVLMLDAANPLPGMPAGSQFGALPDAYQFIVDFYDAFSFDPDTRDVFLLRIDRGPWDVQVLPAVDSYFGYLAEGPLPAGAAQLDSVFYFRNTPYRWLPLVIERVKHKH